MPKRMTAEEARAAGFTEEISEPAPKRMTAEEAKAQGFTEEVADDSPSKETMGTGSSFLLNALDGASIVGVPKVLAAKDALFGEESAKASQRTDDDDPEFDKKGLIDRYTQNKRFYEKGMDRTMEEHPVASVAGQLAPALIPGASGPKAFSVARGATTGALHGALGGRADTADGDMEGTVIDTALGALGGAAGEVIGSGAGKVIKYVGDKAGKKLSNLTTEKVASILGKYGQRKKDAVAAVKNLAVQETLEKVPVAAQGADLPESAAGGLLRKMKQLFPEAEKDLYDASASNAYKQVRRFEGAKKRFDNSTGVPNRAQATKIAEKALDRNSTSAIKNILKLGATAYVGSKAGEGIANSMGMSGNSGAAFGAAAGGAGGLYVTRKLARELISNPRILKKVSAYFPGLGQKLATAGGNTGTAIGYLTAALASEGARDAVKQAVDEADAEDAVAGDVDEIDAVGEVSNPDAGIDEIEAEVKKKHFKPAPAAVDEEWRKEEARKRDRRPTGGEL